MSRIQTANLPPAQQRLLHGDFLANEQAYFKMRDDMLAQYRGQWVAVYDGKIIAAGAELLDVMEKAAAVGGHPYIALVGGEETTVFRVRRSVFNYDLNYRPFPLPRLSATFWNHGQTHSQAFGDVIPDTGADISVLPQADCQAIDLFNSPYLTGQVAGMVGAPVTSVIYQAKVEMDGKIFFALIQSSAVGAERIIGRDVLNQQRVLFDGPARQVVIDP